MGGNVGRRLRVTARGHLPTSLGRAKHDCLVASGALGGDSAWLIEHAPKEVTMSTIS
jgi:hypothetical protein